MQARGSLQLLSHPHLRRLRAREGGFATECRLHRGGPNCAVVRSLMKGALCFQSTLWYGLRRVSLMFALLRAFRRSCRRWHQRRLPVASRSLSRTRTQSVGIFSAVW
jgi:hypothetical protein